MTKTFVEYWDLRMKSAAARLAAAQRVIQHNPTRGSTAENALRSRLRELLPQRCGIGSGFLLAPSGAISRQLDVVIFDQFESSPLCRDGELVIVSPDSAYLAIGVKSSLDSTALSDAFANIASVKSLSANVRGIIVWDVLKAQCDETGPFGEADVLARAKGTSVDGEMCRALGESEGAAGKLVAHMPDKQDAIRKLALLG